MQTNLNIQFNDELELILLVTTTFCVGWSFIV